MEGVHDITDAGTRCRALSPRERTTANVRAEDLLRPCPATMAEPKDLERIAESLRRQRKNVDDLLEGTSSRCDQAAELAGKIEELRRRSEETTRRFGSVPPKTKPTR